MSYTTTEITTMEDGEYAGLRRWRLLTTDDSDPERFISTVENVSPKSPLIGLSNLLNSLSGITDGSAFESICHDRHWLSETRVTYSTKGEAIEGHAALIKEFFKEKS